ncbi:selenide, water dikinase [Evansella caseinilytica]|uniref:Selenide, water dikinase n=1 Tax=Evansella caseinilytica TaxID=1503961 RepID=A0A1H3SYP4_9BACI|nr:selenide, water dikinase SelD [Evansella caseinilytica]SDZ43243.1 selenide, water dikinase [Evansella caseinilytica]
MDKKEEIIRLTAMSSKAGCGCKIGPADLTQVLRYLPQTKKDKRLLVGHETSDDGGVYQVTDDIALVQTVDYFTPVVDDPYMFGQIAAANALSDVYAMGGKPATVLNIVGFPVKKLPHRILAEILKGAADKVSEAGAVIAGGHSIDDNEPKFGLSVTGIVHPDRIFKNVGAKAGDILVLTKPLGAGILTTGIKRGKTIAEQAEAVTATMAELNRIACETLEACHPHAVTDVTGFGLLGHAYEMASGSGVSFHIASKSVPLLPGTKALAAEGIVPGGSKANHQWLEEKVEYSPLLTEAEKLVLCDAITSGGLLISLPEIEAAQYVQQLNTKAVSSKAAIIGKVDEKSTKAIYVD